MTLNIDTDQKVLTVSADGVIREVPLFSAEAFALLSRQWIRVGWALKYSYSFTWLGRPIIQMPEDLLRIQELVWSLRPDVIIETGIAHGGSLIFSSSLCRLMGKGRVIGIDIEIRPHNRRAIEAHPLADLITLHEGSSTDPSLVAKVHGQIQPGESVLVLLDSKHSKDHVLSELEMYSPLVTPGSYIVVADGVMEDLTDVPGGRPEWSWDNPRQAAMEFAQRNPIFELVEPPCPFNEGFVSYRVTYWPGAFLRRKA
jgi:cephalosporin hydroxylase